MAQAADFGDTPMDLPAEPCCVSNWYLKGFLGITTYDLDGISRKFGCCGGQAPMPVALK
jgi:hypothetical protein